MQAQHARATGVLLTLSLLISSMQFVHAQERKQQTAPTGAWKQVNDILGRAGEQESPGVWKYDLTRDDLHVKVNGTEIKPELALDGWLAFQQASGKTRLMGELVLTSGEIGPVVGKLQDGGVRIMALHNHLTGESPGVMYMHIMSEGDPVGVAEAVHNALALSKTPAHEQEKKEPVQGINAEQIHRIIGGDLEQDSGVLSLEVKRKNRITDDGLPVPPAMETSSEAKFQPTENGQALMYGEIVLTASEVNPVLRTLRQNGITIMALHNHMLTEQPRLFFVHCLGRGDPLTLARALRAALDQTESERASGRARRAFDANRRPGGP